MFGFNMFSFSEQHFKWCEQKPDQQKDMQPELLSIFCLIQNSNREK